MKKIRFWLNGCDIYFLAEAPADMTVEQLVKQASRIKPDWCACGIRGLTDDEKSITETEIIFDYDNVVTTNEDVNCTIKEVIE